MFPLLFPTRQCLFGTHGNQVTLNLGHQAESKAKHLAVDVILKHITLLGAIQYYLLLDTGIKNGHNLQ